MPPTSVIKAAGFESEKTSFVSYHTQMPCRVLKRVREGSPSVILENDFVSAEVLPGFGGRIWTLSQTSSSRNWIWHHPNVQLARHPLGTGYDDHWAGGWEELFPNDAAETVFERALPDHGEWWSQAWSWDLVSDGGDMAQIRLWLDCPISNTMCEKWLTIRDGIPELSIRYRISNRNAQRLFFLLKQHLAVAVQPYDRIELPGGDAESVDAEFSSMVQPNVFSWPVSKRKSCLSGDIDMSKVPPASSLAQEFLYVRNLLDGWCGVFSPTSMSRLRMYFDRQDFPFVWLFMTYGRWRGLYTVVLEPCTNLPKSLNAAIERGTSASVLPGNYSEYNITVAITDTGDQ